MATLPAPAADTPVSFVRAIVAALQRGGIDPAPLLAQARIAPALLRRPQACVGAAQMELIAGLAMQALDDEGLGAFSRRLPWGSYGMLARASLSAPDLGLALSRWCRHHGLIADDITLALQRRDGQACMAITEQRDLRRPDGLTPAAGELAREFCLVHVLRNIHGLAGWFIDSRIALDRVALPFAEPAHHAAYPRLFNAPVRFDAPRAELWFDARYLALPLRRDEAAMRQMLQRALPLTVTPYRRDRLLVAQVRRLLSDEPGAGHTAASLAARLHVSVRTLHRQLRDEGASLQALKDEVRAEHARALLLRSGRPVKQVAEAVGYRNEKSFRRAFRGWTGQTPGTVAGEPT